jgi:ribonuclease HI/ADP-ribose pyrophosphatase YjhB (NUDIX family)
MSSNVIMYVKGVARGTPGPAGIGVIICDHWGRIVKKIHEYIGSSTSIQSEFRALLRGIEEIRNMNAFRVKVFSDNEPMIKHMTGIYKVKGDDLIDLLEQIRALSKGLLMEFIQVHPLKNREAETLAKEAIDRELAREKEKPPQPAPPVQKETPKGDLDIRAIKAAVQRAMLLEEFTKGEEPLPSPEITPPVDDRPPALREVKVHPQFARLPDEEKTGDISEDINLEEKEERQISAGGVVYKKEGQKYKICLIAKKNKRVWAFPKGRVNAGENLEETARREIAEETGHLTEVREKIDEISYYFYWKDANIFYHKTVYFFLMPLMVENYCSRDMEADDVIWLTLGEAYKKLTYINEKEILKKAQKILLGK